MSTQTINPSTLLPLRSGSPTPKLQPIIAKSNTNCAHKSPTPGPTPHYPLHPTQSCSYMHTYSVSFALQTLYFNLCAPPHTSKLCPSSKTRHQHISPIANAMMLPTISSIHLHHAPSTTLTMHAHHDAYSISNLHNGSLKSPSPTPTHGPHS